MFEFNPEAKIFGWLKFGIICTAIAGAYFAGIRHERNSLEYKQVKLENSALHKQIDTQKQQLELSNQVVKKTQADAEKINDNFRKIKDENYSLVSDLNRCNISVEQLLLIRRAANNKQGVPNATNPPRVTATLTAFTGDDLMRVNINYAEAYFKCWNVATNLQQLIIKQQLLCKEKYK